MRGLMENKNKTRPMVIQVQVRPEGGEDEQLLGMTDARPALDYECSCLRSYTNARVLE